MKQGEEIHYQMTHLANGPAVLETFPVKLSGKCRPLHGKHLKQTQYLIGQLYK